MPILYRNLIQASEAKVEKYEGYLKSETNEFAKRMYKEKIKELRSNIEYVKTLL